MVCSIVLNLAFSFSPVKPASTSLESKLYSAKELTYSESPRKLMQRQESKASAKLAALKQKSEVTKQENGTPKGDGSRKGSGAAKGKTASPKEEKTPKKISPQKSKVGLRNSIYMASGHI